MFETQITGLYFARGRGGFFPKNYHFFLFFPFITFPTRKKDLKANTESQLLKQNILSPPPPFTWRGGAFQKGFHWKKKGGGWLGVGVVWLMDKKSYIYIFLNRSLDAAHSLDSFSRVYGTGPFVPLFVEWTGQASSVWGRPIHHSTAYQSRGLRKRARISNYKIHVMIIESF